MAASSSAPAICVRDLRFSYPPVPGAEPSRVLAGASFEIAQGEFCLLVGDNGAGKTTLLRLLKPEVSPAGERSGETLLFGLDAAGLDPRASAELAAWVGQGPDGRLVCDSVWHELAFCLENLGFEQDEMRRRVAEVSYRLGLERLFRRKTAELSGGQAQLVSLAAALVSEPRLLLLDEPTAMLDPMARADFAHALFRLNRELGITVVVATHEPWTLAPYATSCLRIRDGIVEREDLGAYEAPPELDLGEAPRAGDSGMAVAAEEVWQRYAHDAPWVLRDCSATSRHGEICALVGGNGSGKSTLLRVLAGTQRIRRGRLVRPDEASQALLPQNPEALLACDDVEGELMEWSRAAGYGLEEARAMAERLGILDLLGRDPFDLSHGQRQLVALAKVALARPRLLLADEPTLGLDPVARRRVAELLRDAARDGASVVMATHDLGLVRSISATTSMLFDGGIACAMPTPDFFARNVLYG